MRVNTNANVRFSGISSKKLALLGQMRSHEGQITRQHELAFNEEGRAIVDQQALVILLAKADRIRVPAHHDSVFGSCEVYIPCV